MTSYPILLTSVVLFSCEAYESTRYKNLLEQTQAVLEQQKALVNTKISLQNKPVSVAALDLSEQKFIDAAQKEFVKQLKIKGVLIEQRLQGLKERQTALGSISSHAEEERFIQQFNQQLKATAIKDQLDDILLTEAFMNKQQSLQQRRGRELFSEGTLSSLDKKWSAKKAELMSKLDAIQAG